MVEPIDLLERGVEGGRGLGVGDGVDLQTRQLQLTTRDRDRRAKLVAGVVEKHALVLERVFDPFEEVVEPARQLGELLPGVLGHGETATELARRAGGDHVGVFDHLLHGRQRGAGQEPAGDGHKGGEQRKADRQRQLQAMLGPGRLLQRGADDDHLTGLTDGTCPQS